MIVDLFGGVGGWIEGLPSDTDHRSVELDPLAAAASRSAGHQVIEADVTALDPTEFAPVTGLTGSPPCQPWSVSGTGEGRADRDRVLSAVSGRRPALDHRTRLTVEPLRWIRTLRPEWVALEQVPPVLPVWRAYADRLTDWGYATAVGVVDAADYGVPQSRRRAVLIANRTGAVALPEPTPRISISAALNLPADDPRQLRSNYSGHVPGNSARTAAERGRTMRTLDQQSVTITRRPPQWLFPDGDRVALTVPETAVLQGFPPSFPFQGTISDQRLQCGNAVPPPLARSLIHAASHPVGPMPRPSTVTIGVHIPRDLHRRLKLAAVEHDSTLQEMVLEALRGRV
ncbi:MAG: DNA cytosine methyltransferase [Gordonia amarae]